MKIKNIASWLFRFGLICTLLFPATGLSQEKKLVSFEFEDQYKQEYTEVRWQDSILIFLGSDSNGSKYNSIWSDAVYDSLQINLSKLLVKRIGLADLRGVPFFMKTYIRNQFRDDTKKLILMDWDGIFPKTYDFAAGECNILIFDLNRTLVYQTSVKELDKIKFGEILKIFRELSNT